MSDIQEEIKLAHKRAEENDIKLLQEEIKEILDNITDDIEYYYVGINGCLYQDLTKEQLLSVKNYITNLQEELNGYKQERENLFASIKKIQKENKRLNNIIENTEKYIRYWNRKGISQNTMLILNDILLIKNGMSDKVVRLKEK